MDPDFLALRRVLLVDDCAPVRASIKGMLQQIGFKLIYQAKDAVEAISICEQHALDFILCDFNLGDCQDGYQLFETLKSRQLLHSMCCFVIISAESQRQIVHGVIELQPDDYILKPFTFPVLKERMVKVMKEKMALRKIFQASQGGDLAEACRQADVIIRQQNEVQLQAERLKGELLLQAGNYQQAETYYQQLVNQRKPVWSKLGLAISILQQQRFDEAEQLLTELTEHDETAVESRDYLAHLYFRRGNLKRAFEILQYVTQLSPKNIPRQKTMANLALLCHDFAAAARIFHKIVGLARHSMHDSAQNYLNHARCIIDNANQQAPIDRANALGHVGKLLDSLVKRFSPELIAFDLQILQVRLLCAKGKPAEAKQLLAKYQQLTEQEYHPETCLDAAKAYFETGDIFGCYFYVTQLRKQLNKANFLTDSQRLLLDTEQRRYEALYQQLKQLIQQATDAYQQQEYGKAVLIFSRASKEMPTNPALALSLLQAMTKCTGVSADTLPVARNALSLLQSAPLEQRMQERFKQYQQILSKQYSQLQNTQRG